MLPCCCTGEGLCQGYQIVLMRELMRKKKRTIMENIRTYKSGINKLLVYQWTCNQTACLFLNKLISPFPLSCSEYIKGRLHSKSIQILRHTQYTHSSHPLFQAYNRVCADIIMLSCVLFLLVNLHERLLLHRYITYTVCHFYFLLNCVKKKNSHYCTPTHAPTLIMIL